MYNANKMDNAYSNNSNMLAIMNDRWRTITENGQTAQWVVGTTAYGIAPDQLAALNANAKIGSRSKHRALFTRIPGRLKTDLSCGSTQPSVQPAGKDDLEDENVVTGVFYFINNLAVRTSYSGYDPEAE